jgi:hypothetical protein
VRSAWNSRSVGVEPLIRLVHARADPRHDQRLAPRVTELVVAARRQNDGTILPRINDCFTVSAGIELRVALQHQENVILLRVRMERVFADSRCVTVNS